MRQQNEPRIVLPRLAQRALQSPYHSMTTEDQSLPNPPPSAADGGTANAAVEGSGSTLAVLEAKVAELSDLHLRAKAEVENVRRRADEEIAKARKYALEAFAESLLPVKDSLEAALVAPGGAVEHVLEGVSATLRQLSTALEKNMVSQINPSAGEAFDPHQHQAITLIPSEHAPNAIVSVLQKGYRIADRVLRPALVTVSAPK